MSDNYNIVIFKILNSNDFPYLNVINNFSGIKNNFFSILLLKRGKIEFLICSSKYYIKEEGDFFNQVNKMGASTNASTGFAETNYYISSNLLNESDLETKIKLHASMLESPLFAIEKLEKEKGIVNSTGYVENTGYQVRCLKAMLYILAVTEPETFYFGAVRETDRRSPEVKVFNECCVFFPYFDDKGRIRSIH